jgi:ER membrane protein complex subunit 2
VLRKIGRIENAIEELSRFVDTFYTDVEAWLELADLYASYHQYGTFTNRSGCFMLTPKPGIP